MAHENSLAAKNRLQEIEGEIKTTQEQINRLSSQWGSEKVELSKVKDLQEKIKKLENDVDRSEGLFRKGTMELKEYHAHKLRVEEVEIPALEADIQRLQSGAQSNEARMLSLEVGPNEIAQVIEEKTGIPVQKMLQSESERLLHMEDHLHKRVIGQSEAVRAVSKAIRRSRAGFGDPNRPVGSFLFLGPSGTGKTELAKALTEYLFNTEKALIRFDMSEYKEAHTVSKLIGSPAGYVGYEDGGQLTEAVRRNPYSVILFDEVEKAHPQVFDTLLQVMDEGHLTDSHGHRVNFKNTVIVMTSNLGSEFIADPKLSDQKRETAIQTMVKTQFRPEFLNRLNGVITFESLTSKEITQVAGLQANVISERLKALGIQIEFSETALNHLAQKSNAGVKQAGVRHLKTFLETEVLDPLTDKKLAGEIREGSVVRVTVENSRLNFAVSQAMPAQETAVAAAARVSRCAAALSGSL